MPLEVGQEPKQLQAAIDAARTLPAPCGPRPPSSVVQLPLLTPPTPPKSAGHVLPALPEATGPATWYSGLKVKLQWPVTKVPACVRTCHHLSRLGWLMSERHVGDEQTDDQLRGDASPPPEFSHFCPVH